MVRWCVWREIYCRLPNSGRSERSTSAEDNYTIHNLVNICHADLSVAYETSCRRPKIGL